MAFGGNNKDSNKINTSTRGLQFYNKDAGDDCSTISFGFWNNYASIKINPPLDGKDAGRYNYDSGVSIVASAVAIKRLSKIVSKIEFSKKKDGKIHSGSIRIKDNMIKIGDGTEYDGMGWYLAIFSVDASNKATDGIFYVFNTNSDDDEVFFNYDEETGKASKKKIPTEFELFKIWLEEAAKGLTNASSHGANVQLGYFSNNIQTKFDILKGVVETGLYSGKGRSTGSSSSGNSSSFGGGSSTSGYNRKRRDFKNTGGNDKAEKGSKAKEEEIDDISDLENMMED